MAGDITAAMPSRAMINIINFIQAVDIVVPGFASPETECTINVTKYNSLLPKECHFPLSSKYHWIASMQTFFTNITSSDMAILYPPIFKGQNKIYGLHKMFSRTNNNENTF